MLKVLALLVTMTQFDDVTNCIHKGEYAGKKKATLDILLTDAIKPFHSIPNKDIREAVEFIDKSRSGPEAVKTIKPLLKQRERESDKEFERRVLSVARMLPDRVAIVDRCIFECNVVEPVENGSYFYFWDVISASLHDGKVDRQFPLVFKDSVFSVDPRGFNWGGGSGPGENPLKEFDYYATHFSRRKS